LEPTFLIPSPLPSLHMKGHVLLHIALLFI
jgi:hypothetical protein